jgi:hypothetical protein
MNLYYSIEISNGHRLKPPETPFRSGLTLLNGSIGPQDSCVLVDDLKSVLLSEVAEPFRKAVKQIHLPTNFHFSRDPRVIARSFIMSESEVADLKEKP